MRVLRSGFHFTFQNQYSLVTVVASLAGRAYHAKTQDKPVLVASMRQFLSFQGRDTLGSFHVPPKANISARWRCCDGSVGGWIVLALNCPSAGIAVTVRARSSIA